MAQRTTNQMNITDGIAVCGYIRENFDKKCWIEEIVATIIQFYITMIKGGSLYMCGNGKDGRLGIKDCEEKLSELTLCPQFINNNAHKVSVGRYHTLILDINGNVWCCGYGKYGQLGNGEAKSVYVPTKLKFKRLIAEISAGAEHSLLLFDDGTVKGCGSNKCGQLGQDSFGQFLVPKTIETLKKYMIIQISAGGYHSTAWTEDGVLFCFGYHMMGQCGVGKKKEYIVKFPTKVDFDDNIEFVGCGSYHTLVITRKGLIYSFGAGYRGQLGHGNQEKKYVPSLIWELKEKRMKMCAAGYEHSLCIDKEGIIWSFGRNRHGQCGLSEDIKMQRTPITIEWFIKNNTKAEECFAGWNASSIIANDGSLYVFGAAHGQFGLEAYSNSIPSKPHFPDQGSVQAVSLGEEHSAIIFNSH